MKILTTSFLGFRYCDSRYERAIDNLIIEDDFWGDYTFDIPSMDINASWIEGVIGLKTEIFKNLFFGWTIRCEILVSNKNDPVMDLLYIPGYGKKNTMIGGGFTYSILYRFPFK